MTPRSDQVLIDPVPGPTVQIPADYFPSFVQALETLPEIQSLLYEQDGTRRDVTSEAFLPIDVDDDGQEESFWVYLIRLPKKQASFERTVAGYLGQALFDSENHLMWYSTPEELGRQGTISQLTEEVSRIIFAPGEEGILQTEYTLYSGEGRLYKRLTTLSRWDGHELGVIWQQPTGGNQGVIYYYDVYETIAFRDVDGSNWPELLLRHREYGMQSDNGPRRRHYQIILPGAIAFRWDGKSYLPGYFVGNDRDSPVPLRLPMFWAPRFSVPITLDGNDGDWWQVEYRDSLRLPPERTSSPPEFNVAWDQQYLYLVRPWIGRQSFHVALDTDLTGDIGEEELNQDDFVWEVTVGDSPQCQTTVSVLTPHSNSNLAEIYQIVSADSPYIDCSIEMAIPLSALGLSGNDLVPEIGWVAGDADSHNWREYHPRAGRVVGFAMEVLGEENAPVYEWDDPTTWSTLVFMADR